MRVVLLEHLDMCNALFSKLQALYPNCHQLLNAPAVAL